MRTDRTAGALRLASALGFIAGFGAPPLLAAQDLPFDADAGVQSATAEDIRIMTPYIGRFRSPTRADPQSGELVYHEIEYRWVDQGKTNVAVEVTTHGADSGEVASFVRGYYAHPRRVRRDRRRSMARPHVCTNRAGRAVDSRVRGRVHEGGVTPAEAGRPG